MDASIPPVPDVTLAVTKSSKKRYQYDSFGEWIPRTEGNSDPLCCSFAAEELATTDIVCTRRDGPHETAIIRASRIDKQMLQLIHDMARSGSRCAYWGDGDGLKNDKAIENMHIANNWSSSLKPNSEIQQRSLQG